MEVGLYCFRSPNILGLYEKDFVDCNSVYIFKYISIEWLLSVVVVISVAAFVTMFLWSFFLGVHEDIYLQVQVKDRRYLRF